VKVEIRVRFKTGEIVEDFVVPYKILVLSKYK